MRVAYVTFEARGGMMHYAESLGSAARRILEAHVVVVAPEAGVAPFRERRGYLTQALSASVTRHRLLEKYNRFTIGGSPATSASRPAPKWCTSPVTAWASPRWWRSCAIAGS